MPFAVINRRTPCPWQGVFTLLSKINTNSLKIVLACVANYYNLSTVKRALKLDSLRRIPSRNGLKLKVESPFKTLGRDLPHRSISCIAPVFSKGSEDNSETLLITSNETFSQPQNSHDH